MAERYGADAIYSALAGNSAITTIVGTSIYEDLRVPPTDTSEDTINYYPTGPYSGGIEYFERRFSIDCRRGTYVGSRDLATLVHSTLNREFSTVNSKNYFMVADILTTLAPVNDTDVYNTPVSVYIRRK